MLCGEFYHVLPCVSGHPIPLGPLGPLGSLLPAAVAGMELVGRNGSQLHGGPDAGRSKGCLFHIGWRWGLMEFHTEKNMV